MSWTRARLAAPAVQAARDLLGAHLSCDGVTLRITEVEAYPWPGDSANHCRSGRTPRNAPMWGPPGHAYVYCCYGLHQMLNVVVQPEGQGAAVLIRGAEVVSGHERVHSRRGGRQDLAGPGKVGAALGLDTGWSGHDLLSPGGLELAEGTPPSTVWAGPRVGIGFADAADQAAPWRLADGASGQVSHRRALSPAGAGASGSAAD